MEKTYKQIYDEPETVILDLEKDYYVIKNDDGTIYYCKRGDEKKCEDHINVKINIDPVVGESILVDTKIAKLIESLNKCGYETDFCCSGHICDREDWYIDSEGKRIVIYRPDLDTRNFTGGYISFTKKYRDIEKAFTYKKLNCSYREANAFCNEMEKEFELHLLDSIFYVVRMRSRGTVIYWKTRKHRIEEQINKLSILFKTNKFIN